MSVLQIALVQMNSVMGALEQNRNRIFRSCSAAREAGADVVVFPELALCGYPPEDLLLTQAFLTETREALDWLAQKIQGLCVLVGFAHNENGKVYNAAAWLQDGRVAAVYRKIELPNYGVFDEKRYFSSGDELVCVTLKGARLALSICEDLWVAGGAFETKLQIQPADLVLNISASPFHAGKLATRREVLAGFSQRNRAAIAYCNLLGGQDELVFDGGNMFFGMDGTLLAESRRFEETVLLIGFDAVQGQAAGTIREFVLDREGAWLADASNPPVLEGIAEVYQALVLGTRDYVEKNGFARVVIGLSGGVDSALTAALAVAALGRDRVIGVTMPSEFTSEGTLDDARRVAEALSIKLHTIPIEPFMRVYGAQLSGLLGPGSEGVAFENLQARIRGNILMALSNRHGWLVLTTGNKSETATGYCTLYGDMAGGFAVIKDVPKTMVYEVCRYLNVQAGLELISQSVLDRPPSAELRPDQKDEDSLPPYAELDPILKAYVEEDRSPDDIIALGFSPETVMEVIRLVDRSEYKRRQAPPGIKITPKAFGRDRRLPLTNQYRPRSTHFRP
ncbi:MAG: NAD+ synthase [Candidatus Firestonebacteria bacterium]|nr:NAD+ synthase [Candidatus Firestonebacteria bacterium]